MRVLITGGSGLIGRAVARDLRAAGGEVGVLSREPQRALGLPAGARAERWDGRTAEGWSGLLGRDSALVHLAGEGVAEGRWTEERKRRIRASRVDSSRAVLQAIQQAPEPPRVLLQASATGYYGHCGDEVVTEDHPPGEDFLADVCREWEASTAAVEALGVRRAVLRTGLVLTKEGGALPKLLLPFRFGAGGPMGGGGQWLPWIHVADEVAAIRFLLEQGDAHGPFNLSAPQPLTNRDFSRLLGRALRRPSFLPTPAFALRLALGEMADALLSGQRAVPHALEALGFTFRYPEAEAALRDLLA
ncbi:MAG TPA: TIGR01777 family oxidoreductase [Thermoanaerobaculia bacterium]